MSSASRGIRPRAWVSYCIRLTKRDASTRPLFCGVGVASFGGSAFLCWWRWSRVKNAYEYLIIVAKFRLMCQLEKLKNLGSPWLQKMPVTFPETDYHLESMEMDITKMSRAINTNKIVFEIPIEYNSIKMLLRNGDHFIQASMFCSQW